MPPEVVSTTDAAAKVGRARDANLPIRRFVPRLRVGGENLLVDVGEGLVPEYEEVKCAVLELAFVYDGIAVAASDPSDHVLVTTGGKRRPVLRDFAGEARARQLLESYGPVELDGLDAYEPLPGSRAEYLVDLAGDIDALCAFASTAVPKLQGLGWDVVIEDSYPCCVVRATQWYADIGATEGSDWFELEMGVEVDGKRVDLLPALIELLHSSRSASGLARRLERARRPVAVPLGGRDYLPVPPERLQAIVEVLAELYAIDGMTAGGALKVPKLAPGYLDELESELGQETITWSGDAAARSQARQLLGLETPPRVKVPGLLKASLRPYQQEGLNWLQSLRAAGVGGVLADDMGLGKTLQTIAHIVTEKASGRMTAPVLVVGPTSLVGNWQRELAKFAPSLKAVAYHGPTRGRHRDELAKADVIITSYPILVRDAEQLQSRRYHMLVLDEAQIIKNIRSQAHKAVKEIEAEHRLCLSGTPIENNLEELWALFDFLMPGLLGSVQQFRAAFRTPIEKLGNAERLASLRRRVAPFILRRLKESVATELPPKTEIIRPVELTGSQRELYEAIRIAAHAEVRQVVRKKGIAASTIDILGALMKLRQACCDPRLVRVSAAREVEESAKLEALLEMLDELIAGGRRILVFSQFTSMLAIIGDCLRQRGVRYVSLTGQTTARDERVAAFQNGEAEVFLISLKAGGTGLNLTAADAVIHVDPWWNPQAQAQATDRAYRIGQTKPVFVYHLVVSGSVEERMLGLQQRKRELANGLLSSDGRSAELSERDVDDLFAPLD